MENILKAIKALFRKTQKDIEESKAVAEKAISKIYFVAGEDSDGYTTTETVTGLYDAVSQGKIVIYKPVYKNHFQFLYLTHYDKDNKEAVFSGSSSVGQEINVLKFSPDGNGGYTVTKV